MRAFPGFLMPQNNATFSFLWVGTHSEPWLAPWQQTPGCQDWTTDQQSHKQRTDKVLLCRMEWGNVSPQHHLYLSVSWYRISSSFCLLIAYPLCFSVLLRYNWHIALCRFKVYGTTLGTYTIKWSPQYIYLIWTPYTYKKKKEEVFFLAMRTLRLCSLSNFQAIYHTAVLMIVTILYIISPALTCLITGICTSWSTASNSTTSIFCPW